MIGENEDQDDFPTMAATVLLAALAEAVAEDESLRNLVEKQILKYGDGSPAVNALFEEDRRKEALYMHVLVVAMGGCACAANGGHDHCSVSNIGEDEMHNQIHRLQERVARLQWHQEMLEEQLRRNHHKSMS